MIKKTKEALVYYNAFKHYFIQNYLFSKLKRDNPADVEELHSILDNYSKEKTVFIQVGLSDIKAVFHKNPYKLLLDVLDEHFDSVLAPGFTPYFEESGVYHKLYSVPTHGTFYKLFLKDADYRTNDATHSILVRGDYRFDNCDHFDTLSRDGCWGKLDSDNMLIMDIGTPWMFSSQHHYIEGYYDVPYCHRVKHEGRIFYENSKNEKITQTSYTYDFKSVRRNLIKLENYLHSREFLDKYDINGLKIRLFRARDMRKAYKPKIKRDSYYLIT